MNSASRFLVWLSVGLAWPNLFLLWSAEADAKLFARLAIAGIFVLAGIALAVLSYGGRNEQ